jgi:DNA-binding NtrC family response regulator
MAPQISYTAARLKRQTGRVVIVDGDPLARWSLGTYLRRWYTVEEAECGPAGAEIVRAPDLAVLILSDELPGQCIAQLEEIAQRHHPNARVVRTVTGVNPKRPRSRALLLEKPFQLHELACLLGIPAAEVRCS